jgi:hypothetical protein
MKTANLTNRAVYLKNHPNPLKPNAVFTVFNLDWFNLRFYFWFGSDTSTPNEIAMLLVFVKISLNFSSLIIDT